MRPWTVTSYSTSHREGTLSSNTNTDPIKPKDSQSSTPDCRIDPIPLDALRIDDRLEKEPVSSQCDAKKRRKLALLLRLNSMVEGFVEAMREIQAEEAVLVRQENELSRKLLQEFFDARNY